MSPQALLTRFRDRLEQSRFVTVSLTLHAILLLVLATVVAVDPPKELAGFIAPERFVDAAPAPAPRPRPESQPEITLPSPHLQRPAAPQGGVVENPLPVIPRLDGPGAIVVGLPGPVQPVPQGPVGPGPEPGPSDSKLSRGELKAIGDFTKYRVGPAGSSNPTFEFTAYIGRYRGNWDSTVQVSNGEITAGSLPNLLYVTSRWSKERIRTNERAVKAIPLDSAEIFETRPPFIFLTGTRDFTLTAAEVENLRNYLRLGGAIWGDSSVPGRRSAFDHAFRREMKRVLGENTPIEALPDDHPVLAKGYFPKVRSLPPGINHYRDPVQVMRFGGEIAVIHTTNDYGDMWQIGLDKDGRIDLSRNERGQYVAMNANLWDNRGVYIRNVTQPAVEDAYKFGINMIFHLLTRWESRTANLAPL